MNDATSMIKLYSERILSLAANLPVTDPLEAPDGSASKRSPLCGSNIRVEITLTDGKISEFHQDVKACALGQSAASVFAANVIGMDLEGVRKGRDQLFAMLTNDGPIPDPPFQELAVLEAAKEYKNRHASIMLVFEATLAAFEETGVTS